MDVSTFNFQLSIKKMKALIIEDEPVAAEALQTLISQVAPDIEIVGKLESIEESVEWFSGNTMPALVFMDIHLSDGSSFAIFDEVKITCPVIFTTAYDEYALRAFQVNSIDYLLKPINRTELERAIQKFRKFTPAIDQQMLSELFGNLRTTTKRYKSNFLVPVKDRLIPLLVDDIAFIYTENKVVRAYKMDKTSLVMENTLEELAQQLDPAQFFRANRQFIISRRAIKDIALWFNGKLVTELTVPSPEQIVISKERATEFKNWCNQ
jgi:two-component system, LytTR family, response regulator LytT